MKLLDTLRLGWQPGSSVRDRPTGHGFAVVDVQTTGLSARWHRIIEIAVIRTDPYGRVLDEWSTLLNPAGSVGATGVHGLAAADVYDAPSFGDVAGELTARLAGRALVAHNAPFALAFLGTEYARTGHPWPAGPVLCTLEASRTYLPELARRRLTDCCAALRVPFDTGRTALVDARMTAALLAAYLDPAVGVAPTAEHLALPAVAAAAAEPVVASVSAAVPVPRQLPAASGAPNRDGRLAALLADLPMAAAVEHGADPTAVGYLELLAQVLDDRVLTEVEAVALADLAQLYGLTVAQLHAAHQGLLLALAHKIVRDGKMGRAERADLLAAATVLGFPDGVVKGVLDEAQAAMLTYRARACRPLPDSWRFGTPLRIGQRVAFTGGDELERARLEGRAQAAGLRVSGSVSPRTAMLVTDGAPAGSATLRAARQYRTRVVSPAVFAQLVSYVQPAQLPTG